MCTLEFTTKNAIQNHERAYKSFESVLGSKLQVYIPCHQSESGMTR